jgi:NADH:ubiquinone oxidoreductase subunit 2 (subunit N)
MGLMWKLVFMKEGYTLDPLNDPLMGKFVNGVFHNLLNTTLTVVSAIKLSGASFINQTIITNKETTLMKFMMFTSLFSLGGLPPFLGFLPK